MMDKCDYFDECSFFDDNYKNMPVTIAVSKVKYCELNFEYCARYIATKILGQEKVPNDLLPHQTDRVFRIILE